VQRVPRLLLLLEDLIKHTDKNHPDYDNIVKSLEKMKVVANDINTAITLNENRARVVEIQNRFSNPIQGITLVEPHRLFVMEGMLTKICRKSRKKRIFFLFTDVLIYGSTLPNNKILFHRMIHMDNCRLEDVPDLACAFQISSAGKSFIVYAENTELKMKWLLHLTSQINTLREKRMTFSRSARVLAASGTVMENDGGTGNPADSILEAPVWVPDDSVNACNLCGEEFSMLKRRHHCRACGEIVCGNCSDKKWKIPAIDKSSKVRVCTLCHDYLSTHQNTGATEDTSAEEGNE